MQVNLTAKKQNKKNPVVNNPLLAIGTIDGQVLVYNILKYSVEANFQHSNKSPIADLCWKSNTELVTIGNKKLVFWNINKGSPLQ